MTQLRTDADLGWTLYWATGTLVDRLVDIGRADSVREGWYDADCVCGWHTSGGEPVVEDAAHEHVGDAHKADVQAEQLFLAGARAHCEAKHKYEMSDYGNPDDRERHIQADAASTARDESFRAAITATLAALAAVGRLRDADAEPDLWQYAIPDEPSGFTILLYPPRWTSPRWVRRPLYAGGPWLPVPDNEETTAKEN